MFTRLKCGRRTSRLASAYVAGLNRYMTTTGVPRTADSSVAVPDEEERDVRAGHGFSVIVGDDRNVAPLLRDDALEVSRPMVGAWMIEASMRRPPIPSRFRISMASSIAGSSALTSMRREPGSRAMRNTAGSRGGR